MTDLCDIKKGEGAAGYRIELRVNGNVVAGRVLERRHPINIKDIASHAATARCYLKKGDKIEVWVVPIGVGDGDPRVYKIPANRAGIMVTRVRQFD